MSDLDDVHFDRDRSCYRFGPALVSVDAVRQQYQSGVRIAGYAEEEQPKAIARDIARWHIERAKLAALRSR